MIKLLFFQILLFSLASCGGKSNSSAKLNGNEAVNNNEVSVICSCQSDEETVQGTGSDQSAAEKSAQTKCSIIFPSASVTNCRELPQS